MCIEIGAALNHAHTAARSIALSVNVSVAANGGTEEGSFALIPYTGGLEHQGLGDCDAPAFRGPCRLSHADEPTSACPWDSSLRRMPTTALIREQANVITEISARSRGMRNLILAPSVNPADRGFKMKDRVGFRLR
jgi:hypothetical protein